MIVSGDRESEVRYLAEQVGISDGMAIGQNSDVTAEAAGVVVMDNSLRKVDEFMHISRRMRTIAFRAQSAASS
jgi:cation transport ATPase